jgi:P27 family predicted phage terminase small subunit
MLGPAPTPTKLVLLRGNPGHKAKRLLSGPEPEVPPECPDPPSLLSPYAQDEWWRTAPSLHVLGLLSALDAMALAAYCQSYARWREAEEALARVADRDEHMRGLLIKTEGGARRNPLVKLAADAADQMLTFASEFGLTPVARARLAAGVGAQPPRGGGKFEGLIK